MAQGAAAAGRGLRRDARRRIDQGAARLPPAPAAQGGAGPRRKDSAPGPRADAAAAMRAPRRAAARDAAPAPAPSGRPRRGARRVVFAEHRHRQGRRQPAAGTGHRAGRTCRRRPVSNAAAAGQESVRRDWERRHIADGPLPHSGRGDEQADPGRLVALGVARARRRSGKQARAGAGAPAVEAIRRFARAESAALTGLCVARRTGPPETRNPRKRDSRETAAACARRPGLPSVPTSAAPAEPVALGAGALAVDRHGWRAGGCASLRRWRRSVGLSGQADPTPARAGGVAGGKIRRAPLRSVCGPFVRTVSAGRLFESAARSCLSRRG